MRVITVPGHPVPDPPRVTTVTPDQRAVPPTTATARRWEIPVTEFIEQLTAVSHGVTDRVAIIREGGGVWVITGVRRASDGVIELTVRPS
jgi:hypothetical protein